MNFNLKRYESCHISPLNGELTTPRGVTRSLSDTIYPKEPLLFFQNKTNLCVNPHWINIFEVIFLAR